MRKASQLAQQLVEDDRKAIQSTSRETLRNGTRGQKLRAIEMLLKIGLSAERLDGVAGRTELEHVDRDALIAKVAEGLNGSLSGQLVRQRLAEITIDSTAREIS